MTTDKKRMPNIGKDAGRDVKTNWMLSHVVKMKLSLLSQRTRKMLIKRFAKKESEKEWCPIGEVGFTDASRKGKVPMPPSLPLPFYHSFFLFLSFFFLTGHACTSFCLGTASVAFNPNKRGVTEHRNCMEVCEPQCFKHSELAQQGPHRPWKKLLITSRLIRTHGDQRHRKEWSV